MTPRILLLGAGFSRNWGGWLADEVFEFLLGSPHVDDQLRSLLLSYRTKGFEAALDHLQTRVAQSQTPDPQLDNFMKAIEEMFGQMNSGLTRAKFDPLPALHQAPRLK